MHKFMAFHSSRPHTHTKLKYTFTERTRQAKTSGKYPYKEIIQDRAVQPS